MVPGRGAAQRDSVRVFVSRAATPFEQQLEQLARDLLARRQLSAVIANRLSTIQASLRTGTASDSSRAVVLTQMRRLEMQLQSNDSARARLQSALERLCPRDRQPEGWVGVTYTSDWDVDLSPSGSLITRFRGYPGVEVVEPASPAEKAGIQRGDRLVSIGGIDLADGQFSVAGLIKPGARLPVRIVRGVETKHLVVVVEARPADFEVPCAWVDEQLTSALRPVRVRAYGLMPQVQAGGVARARVATGNSGEQPAAIVMPSTGAGGRMVMIRPGGTGFEWIAGAQVSSLNAGMAAALGADRGVVVFDVALRSPASQSGLRGGDVIISADGNRVSSPRELIEYIEQAGSKELKLQVVRLRKVEDVTLRW
jgi:C-terminal processing protease CtpA/Prc